MNRILWTCPVCGLTEDCEPYGADDDGVLFGPECSECDLPMMSSERSDDETG